MNGRKSVFVDKCQGKLFAQLQAKLQEVEDKDVTLTQERKLK
jgi:hypothetical protein